MSKAFTRESDDLPERPLLPPSPSPLPAGAKNYLTSDGAKRLREELDHLTGVERPRPVAFPDDAEAKRRLQMVDQRIAHLGQSLNSAVIVPRPIEPQIRVHFGATVTVRERNGAETRYRIVGVDETDLENGSVSWLSPIAKALLKAEVGQRVRFKFPSGEVELEIVEISYP